MRSHVCAKLTQSQLDSKLDRCREDERQLLLAVDVSASTSNSGLEWRYSDTLPVAALRDAKDKGYLQRTCFQTMLQ